MSEGVMRHPDPGNPFEGPDSSVWGPVSRCSWLRETDGAVHLLCFADPHPRVLTEPAGTVWEVLVDDATVTPGMALTELAERVRERLEFDGPGLSPGQLQDGLLQVLDQLERIGAVTRWTG